MLDLEVADHARIDARLSETRIGFLSTTRPSGRPQTIPVWFAWTGDAVVIFSGAGTAKLRHLRRNPQCSFALETADAGNDVVLIDANAEFLASDAPAVPQAEALIADKYSLGGGVAEWRSQFSVALVLRPTRIVAWSKPGGELRYTVVEQ